MFLLLLQMLLISWLATAEQRGEMQQQKKRVPYILPHNVLTKYVGESKRTLRELEGSVVSLAEMEIKQQDLPQRPRFLFPYDVQRAADDLESWASASKAPASTDLKHPPSHPQTKREAGSPFRKDAKKFWDLFMSKTKSRSEEVVLPIKTNEIYQICNMLPFSQTIMHENCEKLVIQNNLCFGKCSSFHVPGADDRIYSFCSHCSPTKFSTKHLKMNCTMVTPVIKVVMIIEECRCEIQNRKEPEIRFLHTARYSNEH